MSKVKDLKDDRRFTITDPGGNTLYVGAPHNREDAPVFYRTIASETYGHHFALLYDLTYSKEDIRAAHLMMVKLFPADIDDMEADDLDRAKIGLVLLDIQRQRGESDGGRLRDKLASLLDSGDEEHPGWRRLRQRYDRMMSDE